MSKFTVTYQRDATSIDQDEIKDLIPDYISTMDELNQLEQSNIADAFVWAEKQKLEDLLSATFALKLHKKMFGDIWKWAGKARKSNKNIGIFKEQIMNELGQLFNNTQHWIDHHVFSNDEIAVRFHHRLVQIHIFSNGNGRHARLMTDLLLKKLGVQKFSWGKNNQSALEAEGVTRTNYIQSLKAADQGNFKPLIEFVRS